MTTSFEPVRMFSATRASCGEKRRKEREKGRAVSRPRRLFAQKVGRPPGARARVGVHSVPQPRFSVDYTPVVRHSDEERLRNRSSPCTAAPEPKVPRAFAAENEHAQTAKGTPLCKHRGMPSETLVRNSSHSSPRAFVSRASRREKRRATKNQPGDASERQKPRSAVANALRHRKRKRLAPRASRDLRRPAFLFAHSKISSPSVENEKTFDVKRTATSPSSSVCSAIADSSAHAARRSAASGNRSGVAYTATRAGTK